MMLDWEVKWEQEHIVLDFHSQYLSLREKTISSAIIDIPKDIDPFGILQKRITDEVFMTDSTIDSEWKGRLSELCCFDHNKLQGLQKPE